MGRSTQETTEKTRLPSTTLLTIYHYISIPFIQSTHLITIDNQSHPQDREMESTAHCTSRRPGAGVSPAGHAIPLATHGTEPRLARGMTRHVARRATLQGHAHATYTRNVQFS